MIANTLTCDPANRSTVAKWAHQIAMSERSLFRLVIAQTGMSFGRCRQQFQILFAIERLTEGCPVQSAAYALGYEGASAFITIFKKALGQPAGQYLRSRRNHKQPAPMERDGEGAGPQEDATIDDSTRSA